MEKPATKVAGFLLATDSLFNDMGDKKLNRKGRKEKPQSAQGPPFENREGWGTRWPHPQDDKMRESRARSK